MMKWKCKASGNIIELPDYEFESMKGHDGYEQVLEEVIVEEPKKKPAKKFIDNETDSI